MKEIKSGDIFENENTVVIFHNNQKYYLKITKEKKLILTK